MRVFSKDYEDADVALIPMHWDPSSSWSESGRELDAGRIRTLGYETSAPYDEFAKIEATVYFNAGDNSFESVIWQLNNRIKSTIHVTNGYTDSYFEEIGKIFNQARELVAERISKIRADKRIPAIVGGDSTSALGLFDAHEQPFRVISFSTTEGLSPINKQIGQESRHTEIIKSKNLLSLSILGAQRTSEELPSKVFLRSAEKIQRHLTEGVRWSDLIDWTVFGNIGQDIHISIDAECFRSTDLYEKIPYSAYLLCLERLVQMKNRIISFDLYNNFKNEFSVDLLYRTSLWAKKSHERKARSND